MTRLGHVPQLSTPFPRMVWTSDLYDHDRNVDCVEQRRFSHYPSGALSCRARLSVAQGTCDRLVCHPKLLARPFSFADSGTAVGKPCYNQTSLVGAAVE